MNEEIKGGGKREERKKRKGDEKGRNLNETMEVGRH